ncbi:MAG: hypothetical protein HZB51_34205 [Chloroflexi bacterium]|nr:hypothetical protein [Chloroflexota bacterium]
MDMPEQRKKIFELVVTAIITLVISVGAVLGYDFALAQPRQAALMTQISALQAQAFPRDADFGIGVRALPIVRMNGSGTRWTFLNGSAQDMQSGSYLYSSNSDTVTVNDKLAVTGGIDALTVGTITATNVISTAVGFDTTGNGSVSAPAYTFASDPNTGIYRVGADNLGITAGGTKVLDCTAAGCTTTGTHTVTGASALVTTTVGSGGVGTLTVHAAATFTDTAAFNGATDFNAAMNVDANGDFDSISVAGNADLTTVNNSGGDVTINDNVVVTGTHSVGSFLRFTAPATLAVTQGTSFTPLASVQTISSTAAITATSVTTATFTTNDIVFLTNVNASDAITLTNSSTLVLPSAADYALGPDDMIGLRYTGSKWITLFYSNN